MPPLLYFVRHGQTDWNAQSRLQGQADTEMNALGRRQADRNGERLAQLVPDPETFDFVASPMRRTRETMERIGRKMGLEAQAYRTDPRLVEINFGDWHGFTYAELERGQPDATAKRSRDKWRFLPPGENAESYASLSERVRPVLAEFHRPTICVTHGGVIRVLFHLLAGLPPDRAATLNIPQDKVLRSRDGSMEWL